jgi:hypothetical protein
MKTFAIISFFATFASVLAVQPGGDAIGAGLSDEFEKAIYNEG